MSNTKSTDQAAPVVDHGFARQLLGANGFRRVRRSDTYRREVVSLTYGVTVTFEVSHAQGEAGTVATLKITNESTGKTVKKTGDVLDIYLDAIVGAHRVPNWSRT